MYFGVISNDLNLANVVKQSILLLLDITKAPNAELM